MHAGRAIEGAIGSEYKVDALYLSQETQVVMRMDSLSEEYDRQILLSGDLYTMLSEKAKAFTRRIDCVTMAESSQKRDLFCVDIFPTEPLDEDQKGEDEIQNGKFIKHIEFESTNLELVEGLKGMEYVFDYDHDFISLKRAHKPDFKIVWDKCLENYIDGDWVSSQANISVAQQLFPNDGPCRWLADYLEQYKNIAPDTWNGARDIDQKAEVPDLAIKDDEEQDAGPQGDGASPPGEMK